MNIKYDSIRRISSSVTRAAVPFVFLVLVTALCPLFTTRVQAQESMDRYTATNLATDIFARAENSDTSLINPWGMAYDPDAGTWWVADAGRGRATVYSFSGLPFPGLAPRYVNIPRTPGSVGDYSAPTGIVYNSTEAFKLAPDAPSRLILVTRDGSIAGWNSEYDRYAAVLAVDNSQRAVYTGAAIASLDGQSVLYVANFGQGRIDSFGPDFNPSSLRDGAFLDPYLPYGFSPYNVQVINNNIVISYAMNGTDGRTALFGKGSGYVDVFDAKGALLTRLEHGPWLDAPWGIALAPRTGFGKYSGALLVGNSGSGRIAAFDVASGSFLGFLMDNKNKPIVVPGLHGLGFGNSDTVGTAAALYFTAGSRGMNLFGSITPGPASGSVPAALQGY